MVPEDAEYGAPQALLQGLIDYAGLFPPAGLDMARAVRTYAAILGGKDAWMLGRFIVPVSRLKEFADAARDAWREGGELGPWPVSVLMDGDFAEDREAIFAFNRAYGDGADGGDGGAVIDAVEIKVPVENGVPSAAFVDRTLDEVPDELFPFFELPVPHGGKGDIRGCLAVLSDADAAAKLRTGGVKADAFPSAAGIAEFIAACAAANVPFKATAGLHHAMRGEYALTYEPGCPRGVMHGYVNLFLAAGLIHVGAIDAAEAARLLETRDAGTMAFGPGRITWGERWLGVEQIDDVRAGFALSYGSCSFDEPVSEARAIGLLKD